MLPGPDLIKKCPNCGKLAKQSTVASGNNFGAKYWTDGWFFAPMLPQAPQVVDCPHCKNTGWQSDFDEVDRSPAGAQVIFLMQDALEDDTPLSESAKKKLEKREIYRKLPYLEESDAASIASFINSKSMPRDREINARVILWRKWNDSRRSNPEKNPLNNEELNNLGVLRRLMTQANYVSYLVCAEVDRQLGDFESAKTLLDKIPETDRNVKLKEFIGKLVSDRDPYLRRVNFTAT